jgi:hypothetical protein
MREVIMNIDEELPYNMSRRLMREGDPGSIVVHTDKTVHVLLPRFLVELIRVTADREAACRVLESVTNLRKSEIPTLVDLVLNGKDTPHNGRDELDAASLRKHGA